jgi:hypothetical protein
MKGWGVTHTTGSYRVSSFQSQDKHLSNYIHILSAEDGTHIKKKLISDMWYHLHVAMGENLTWQKKIRKTWMKNVLELGQHNQYSAEQPQNCGLIPGIGIWFFSAAQPMGERDVLEL